jgi:glycosyltransferase involved in cell wall biosynthesis
VVREQLRVLAAAPGDHRYMLFARRPWGGVQFDERFRWVLDGAPDPFWHARVADRANAGCDVFLATNSYLTVWFLRIPAVMMVMDMVAYDADLLPNRRSAVIERATLPWALRRAASVVTISQATADDLTRRFPRAASRTTVSPLAANDAYARVGSGDVDRVRAVHGLDRPYVLSVGTLEPRKNLPRLVDAFLGLDPELRADTQLVIVGARGWESVETFAQLAAYPDLVRPLGFVEEADLPALYAGARLFAYPSIYEGFGLPLLEAMLAGVPVLTSDVSSMPEVAGRCALYVDPRDVASIAGGLALGLGDPEGSRALARAGRERAAGFSWDRHTADMVSELQRVARQPGASSR